MQAFHNVQVLSMVLEVNMENEKEMDCICYVCNGGCGKKVDYVQKEQWDNHPEAACAPCRRYCYNFTWDEILY